MQTVLQVMAGKLNLTDHDEKKQPWLLSKKEVKEIIEFHVNRAKGHYMYKAAGLGYSQEQILAKIAETNFRKLINIKQILKNANSEKNYEKWQREQTIENAKKQVAEKLERFKKYNANYIYQLMKYNCLNTYGEEKFITTPKERMHFIKTICYFFSNDERFETELGFDLKKGLWMRGISGIGKTFLFQCIKDNAVFPITIISMLEIYEHVIDSGDYRNEFLFSSPKIYLDDVGSETDSNITYYGTERNWFKNFIELYYIKRKPFNRILISTNCGFDEIEVKYGYRVRSRIKEMFNIIDVKMKDDLRDKKNKQ